MEIELGQPPRSSAIASNRLGLPTFIARKIDTDHDALRASVLGRSELAPGTCQAGWSIFSARRVCASNESLTLICKPESDAILFAQMTGLRLQTERQCCRVDEGLLPRLGSCPAGDSATVGLRW